VVRDIPAGDGNVVSGVSEWLAPGNATGFESRPDIFGECLLSSRELLRT
jgi:hypothetical protein